MVNLARGSRNVSARRQGRTHIVVGEHVAGTDNHGREGSAKNWFDMKLSIIQASGTCKEKIIFYRHSNLQRVCARRFLDRLMPLRRLGRGRVFRMLVTSTTWPQSAKSRRYATQIVEQAGKPLASRQRPVERGHRAGEARIFIMNSGSQHAAEQRGKTLGAYHPARARGVNPGGRQHPLLGAYRKPVKRQRQRRIACRLSSRLGYSKSYRCRSMRLPDRAPSRSWPTHNARAYRSKSRWR